MTVTSVSIIESIHTKLDAMLVDAGGVAVPHAIGGVEKARHKTAPSITWYDHDSDGSFEPLKRSSKDRRRWAEDVDRYKVEVFAIDTDEFTAREVLQLTAHNLILATRKSYGSERGYGVETVRFGKYSKSRDAQAKRGMTMTIDVEVNLLVTDDIWATVEVEFEGTGVMVPTGESPFESGDSQGDFSQSFDHDEFNVSGF